MKTLTLSLLLLFLSPIINAQDQIDSLKLLVKNAVSHGDTANINYYNVYLGWVYFGKGKYDSAICYYQKLITNHKTDSLTVARTLNGIAASYYQMGAPDSSLIYYDQALNYLLNIKTAINDAIEVESNIIMIYKDLGLYEKALEKSFALITKLENGKPNRALASCFTTTASIFEAIEDYDDALEYHSKSLRTHQKMDYRKGVAQALNNIGETFEHLENYDSAIANFKKSLTIKTEIDDQYGIAHTLNSLANVLTRQNKLVEAEANYREALRIRNDMKDNVGQAVTLNALAKLKLKSNTFHETLSLLKRAEQLSRASRSIENLRDNLSLQLTLYNATENYASAASVAMEMMSLKDSIINTAKTKAIRSLNIGFETAKKEKRILLLEKNAQLKQAELNAKQIAIYALFTGIVLLVVIAGLIYRNFKITQKNKVRIETLLKELHHRVKNNLQILSSVLTLHSEQLKDENAQQAMKSSEGRVNAMALIHRKLYNIEQDRKVDLRGYVTELVEYLMNSYGYNSQNIKLNINIPSLHIDIDRAIPLGLILNELITNAFKYAFTDHSEPQLDIIATVSKNNIIIDLGDNGKGLDNQRIQAKPDSFGIKLTSMLVKDLKGNFSLRSDRGTRYTLNIPI